MHSTSTDLSPLYSVFRELREFLPLENTGLTHALQSLAKRNIWALFSVEHTGSMLTLSPVQLGLPSRAHYDNDSIMRVYTEVVSGILDILFKKDTEFGWKSWSAVATARRIVEFEKQLVKVMEVPPQPERWTLQDLQQASPNILWSEFFPPTVSVYSAQFIRRLSDDVLRDINTRTVQMYFIWRTVWKYVTVMGDEYNVPKKKLDVMLYGVRAIPERWEMCVDTMDKSPLGLLMGRYFVSKHPLEVSKAEDMAREMVNELRSRVDTWPWIGPDDNKTRSEIMKKAILLLIPISPQSSHCLIITVIFRWIQMTFWAIQYRSTDMMLITG
ncbi:peptidase M13, N-terminal domain-containing protein [Pilobolus umbonatus]|nr:peptidase M13, N-terminal domain-containing protein [Pilobolus umbonatus]